MALLTKIEEVKVWLPAAYANSASRLPESSTSEEKWLLPILGNDLYQDLVAAYESASLSDDQKTLLSRCQAIIVPSAYIENLPFIQSLITDNGIVALESENTRKAWKWEYNNVIEALKNRCFSAMELLILYLKSNKSKFPKWESSPYNDTKTFAIIRDGSDLSAVSGLQQPHRCFMLLKGLLSTIAELYLVENLGQDYYDALNERIINETISGEETRVVSLLRQAAARLLLKYASAELSIRFDDSGFTLINGNIKDNDSEGKVSATDFRIERLKGEMETTGMLFLNKAIDLLNSKASSSVMPEYFNSIHYSPPKPATNNYLNNDCRTGIFSL